MSELATIKEYLANFTGNGGTVEPTDEEETDFLRELSEIDAEYFNFVIIYQNALNGVSTVSMVDKMQFVAIYEEAYTGTPAESFTNDTYIFVQTYENAFGGFSDTDELEILFGAGPHTFLETYNTALSTGLNNLPEFNSTLPTFEDYGTIDPYSTTFKDVYDDELNGGLNGLAVSEDTLVNPDTNKPFDTIYNEAFGNNTTNNLPS